MTPAGTLSRGPQAALDTAKMSEVPSAVTLINLEPGIRKQMTLTRTANGLSARDANGSGSALPEICFNHLQTPPWFIKSVFLFLLSQ